MYDSTIDAGKQQGSLFNRSIQEKLKKTTTYLLGWITSVETAVSIEIHIEKRSLKVRQQVTRWFKSLSKIKAFKMLVNNLCEKFTSLKLVGTG